jgi:hypothetical protein
MSAERTLVKAVRLSVFLCSFGMACGLGVNSAAAQTGLFDGTYAGTQTLTTDPDDHNYAQCLKGPFKRKMVIGNGAVTYTYNPSYDGQVTAEVDADGTVTGSVETSSGGVALFGKIQGDQFTGKVWSIICTYTLDLKRVP